MHAFRTDKLKLEKLLRNLIWYNIKQLSEDPHLHLTAGEMGNVDVFSYSNELSIERNIGDFIGEVREDTKIKIISIRSRSCTKLPAHIGLFTELEYLTLELMPLTEMPESLSNLQELRHIRITHGHLTEVPSFIGGLKHLITLDMSDNRINKLPDNLANLEEIWEFKFHHNRIGKVPESFKKARSGRVRFFDLKHQHEKDQFCCW